MEQSCSECRRLKRERNDANNALLRLIGEMQRAVMQQEASALSRAKASLDEGMKRCEAARLAYDEHRRTHE